MEYLDERFPHPPLMPVDPVSRARTRLLLHRIEKDLYRNYELVLAGNKTAQSARKELADDLTAISPFLERSAFFMSSEMSLADCVLAPLLWRLPQLKIDLPKQAQSLLDYGARLFRRESFRRSLTEAERELRTHAP
jgi:RNA polymerase-associated protein